ncbi:hypothetical protein KBZ10_11360 [Streptomyces sp. F63]|uniref:hypothetical protein n=1 Tax=Streptomyces sp. F63 TaxID=2824887 RepID=UPI001B383A2B|nr:hypothetical protein [Streptomyces sp. F63]MBQ0985106.1 hypothetical protein [Streptomyces sp. F63]
MTTERSPEDAPEQHAPDRPRQRRSTIIAASVAAAVLLLGGGGAYWASTAGDGGGAPAAADPPPLRLDGYGESTAEGPGIAPGEPDPAGRSYVAKGELPDGPDTAAVHRPRGEVGRAAAERLARALDVPGRARLAGDTWTFGPLRDATGPKLDIARNAPGTWTYRRYGPGGSDNCAEAPTAPKDKEEKGEKGEGSGSGSSSSPACPAPPDLNGRGEPLSAAEAKRAAGPVLKAAGLADAELDAGTTMGAVRVVNANPVVDGLPTYGWHTGLRIGPEGDVVGGSGHLATLEKGPEYPVLGAEETLERLNRSAGGGRVGIGGCASAVPHADGAEPAGPSCDEPLTAPSTLPAPIRSGQDDPAQDGPAPEQGSGGEDAPRSDEPGRTKPAKPEPAAVREAVFGYATHFVAGKQALVPAWLFEVEAPGAGEGDTFTVTYPAVKPEYIAGNGGSSAPGDEPTSGPAEPGEPGGDQALTRAESYSADGRKLTVRFWGGVCTDYALKAEATGKRVTIRITGTEKEPGRACVKIAELMEETAQLAEPLGDRQVVDAADGERVAPQK